MAARRRHLLAALLIVVAVGTVIAGVMRAYRTDSWDDPVTGLLKAARSKTRATKNRQLRERLWGNLARVQAKAGQTATAFRTIERVSPESRRYVYQHIAVSQALAGDLDAARATASRLEEPPARSGVLREVVIALKREGRFAAAKEVAAFVETPVTRSGAYLSIAQAQLRAGDEDSALITAEHCQWRSVVDIHKKLAQASAARGDVEATKQRVLENLDTREEARFFNSLACARAHAGDTEGMEQYLALAAERKHALTEADDLQYLLGVAASTQAAMGNYAKALAIVPKITPLERRFLLYRTIAKAQVRADKFDAALATIALAARERDGHERFGDRFSVCIQVVIKLVDIGRMKEALAFLDHLKTRIPETTGDEQKDSYLGRIAKRQFAAGAAEQAMETIASISTDYVLWDVWSRRAQELSWAGEYEAALKIMDMFRNTNEHDTDSVFSRIAVGQARDAGLFAAAHATLGKVKSRWTKGFNAQRIARAQAKAGDVDGVRNWAETETDQCLRAHIYLGAAEGLLDKREEAKAAD
jgi:tetratricopeptide (TPR) repeat protein